MKKKIGILIIVIIIVLASIYFLNNNKKVIKKENEQIEYNYFVLYTQQGVSVIDKVGNKITNKFYDDIKIPNPSKAVFFCTSSSENGNEVKIINQNNEEILKTYKEVFPIKISNDEEVYEKNMLTYRENNLYGLIDYDGNKITDAKYSSIKKLKNINGEVIVCENNKYGVITKNGEMKIKPQYDFIESDEYVENGEYLNCGYVVGNRGNDGYKYGYISNEGKEYISTEYEDLYRVQEIEHEDIYVIAMKNGKKGLFKNKKQIIECKYQDILYNTVAKIFIVEKNMQYGFINLDGKTILEPEFEKFSISSKCINTNKKNEEAKTYDLQGKEMKNEFVNIYETGSENCFIGIDKENNYSILNANFERTIDQTYNYLFYINNDYLIFVDDNSKKGIVNTKGETKIDAKYDSIYKIGDTEIVQARNKESSNVEFYSKNFEKITEMENPNISIVNGFVKLENLDTLLYIDNNGKTVNEEIVYKNESIYPYYENGKYGFKNNERKYSKRMHK